MPIYDFPLSFMELITLGKRPMGRSVNGVVDYLAKQEIDRATPLLVLGIPSAFVMIVWLSLLFVVLLLCSINKILSVTHKKERNKEAGTWLWNWVQMVGSSMQRNICFVRSKKCWTCKETQW